MIRTVFDKRADAFCRKFLVQGQEPPAAEIAQFEARHAGVLDGLFEQLMLFDRVALRVHGENIPLALLFNHLGPKGLEGLIEQGALRFDHWTVMVVFLNGPLDNVNPLGSGEYSSPAHCDPEVSVDFGLNWSRGAPVGRQRRKLVQKCADLYVKPEKALDAAAVDAAQTAYLDGRFASLGLPAAEPLDRLLDSERRKLARCAEEYVEFTYLAQGGLSAYGDYPLYALLDEAAGRLRRAEHLAGHYDQLRLIETVPDFAALRSRLKLGFRDLVRLRTRRHSVAFRDWLATASDRAADVSVVKAYVDALANRKGLFDTAAGKVTKTVAMTGLGAAAGALIGGVPAAALGGVAAVAAANVAKDLGFGLADTFLLEQAARGWSPRFYFDDLRRLDLTSSPPG